jgi:hypothetical protein
MKETIIIAKITAIQDILIDIHELNIALMDGKQKISVNEIMSIIGVSLAEAKREYEQIYEN